MAKKRGNGEGSISKRPNGTYQGQITIGRDPETGKLKRPTFYGKTRKEVAEKIKLALAEAQKGEFIEKDTVTVGHYADDWLKGKDTSGSKNTYAKYESLVRIHIKPELGSVPIQQAERSTIQDFITEKSKSLSPKTIAEIYMIVCNIFDLAVEDRIIGRTPCRKIGLPTIVVPKPHILSEDELSIVMTGCYDSVIYEAVLLEYGAGTRRGETLGLAVGDLDFDANTIDINKSWVMVKGKPQWSDTATGTKNATSKRKIPCPKPVMDSLKKRTDAHPEYKYVFEAEGTGLPMRPDTYYHMLQKLIEKEINRRNAALLKENPEAELIQSFKVTPHSLRHNFATKMVVLNIHDRIIQSQLGHGDLRSTRRYTHVVEESQQAAIDQMSESINKVAVQLQ